MKVNFGSLRTLWESLPKFYRQSGEAHYTPDAHFLPNTLSIFFMIRSAHRTAAATIDSVLGLISHAGNLHHVRGCDLVTGLFWRKTPDCNPVREKSLWKS